MKHLLPLLLVIALCGCRNPGKQAAERQAAEERRPRQEFRFIGYFPDSRTLAIQFNDGSRSNFVDVGQDIYVALLKSSSKLAYFTNSIQGRYEAKATD